MGARTSSSLRSYLLLVAIGSFAILSLSYELSAHADDEQRVYVRSLPDRASFESYSRELGSDRFGKFIIDVKTDDIYFIDVNVFKIHADFVLGVLLKQPWTAENIREYNRNYELDKPRFILGYITEHLKGVLITSNLYNPEDPNSYTINAKRGLGIRVVEGTRVPEQIIFDTVNEGTKIISRSDAPYMLVFDGKGGIREVESPHRGVILNEERAKRLAKAVESFVPLFSNRHALDIEWLLEGEQVWIVQARPYVDQR